MGRYAVLYFERDGRVFVAHEGSDQRRDYARLV